MAMYANTIWSKVSNMASQPLWAVQQVLWDSNGNIVFDETGKPVITNLKISPPSPAPVPPSAPPIPVVFP